MSLEIPKGWLAAKLDDVADFLDSEREPINSSERVARISGKTQTELYPYYGATGQVGWIDAYRSEGEKVLLGEDAAPFLDSSKDKAYLVKGHYWVNNHAHILQGSCGLIDNRFLCYQLNMTDYHPFVSGSTRLKLTSSAMKQIPFLVAPHKEQTRIVEKLEELLSDLDAGVAELKTAQKKLAQYRQSLLKAAVEGALTAEWRKKNALTPGETGAQLLTRILAERRKRWEEKQLAKFKVQGKTPPKGWQDKYPEPVKPDTTNLPELPVGWVWASVDQVGEVFLGKMLDKEKHQAGEKLPYLRNVSVRWGSIETHDLPEMFFEDDELDRYGLVAGDVLVCEGGEPGRAAVCGKEHEQLKYQKALHRVRLFSLYEPELLMYFLEYIARSGKLERSFTGSTIKHFTKESFITLLIPLPPINEQAEIVAQVKSAILCAQEQGFAITYSLKQSAAQRKNILKSAFSGQLVPQDPHDEPASALLERIRAERASRAVSSKPGRRRTKQETAHD